MAKAEEDKNAMEDSVVTSRAVGDNYFSRDIMRGVVVGMGYAQEGEWTERERKAVHKIEELASVTEKDGISRNALF